MKKIKVKKEGREGIYLVDKKEIISFIKRKKFKTIHNYKTGISSILIGADHGVKSVIEDIENSERIAIMTGKAFLNNMKHALAVIINNELEMFDIGEITKKDLEIL